VGRRDLKATILHDLNTIRMLIDIWEEKIPLAFSVSLRQRLKRLEKLVRRAKAF
jgi:hypothetical protein